MERRNSSRVLRWLSLALGGLVVLLLIVVAVIYIASGRIMNRKVELAETRPLYVPADSITLARGEHLTNAVLGCMDCHGSRLEGKVFFDDPAFGRLYAPNITPGKGGLAADYGIAQFEHTLRHGVRRDGKPAWIMPAHHYCYIADEDLAAVYRYVRSVPPVDAQQPARTLGPIGRMLLVRNKLPLEPERLIDHTAGRPARPQPGPTVDYGHYLARVSCIGCHGPDLAGGPIFGGPPDWPPAANLTKGGIAATYTEADFFHALRDGVRPGGAKLDTIMPSRLLRDMNDDEIRALWAYIQTVPPRPMGDGNWSFASRVP